MCQQAGIRYKNRIKVTEAQFRTQKSRLRRLSQGPMQGSKNMEVHMDEESYFTCSGSQMPSIAEFYTSAGGDTIPHVDRTFAFDLRASIHPRCPSSLP